MSRRQFRIWQMLALIIGLVAIGTNLAGAWLAKPPSGAWTVRALKTQSDMLLFDVPLAVLACCIVLWGVRTAGVATLAIAMALASLSGGLAWLHELDPGPRGPFYIGSEMLVAMLGAAGYVRSTQLFPKRLTATDLDRADAPWPKWPILRRALALMLAPWAPVVLGIAWLVAANISAIALLGQVLLLLVGAAYWYVQYRVGTAKARRRVAWFLYMAVAFALLNLIGVALADLLKVAGMAWARPWVAFGYSVLSATAVCGSIAMAVFGAGAINPGLVLRATVIYGAAAALLLFALNVITSVAVESAAAALGLSDRFVAATLGALAGLGLDATTRWLRRIFDQSRSRAATVANSG